MKKVGKGGTTEFQTKSAYGPDGSNACETHYDMNNNVNVRSMRSGGVLMIGDATGARLREIKTDRVVITWVLLIIYQIELK